MTSPIFPEQVVRLCRRSEANADREPTLFATSADGFREDPALRWLSGDSEWVDPADLVPEGILVVLGEPGIGKTTLIRQLVQEDSAEWIDGGLASSTEIAQHLIGFADTIQEPRGSLAALVIDQLDECADLERLPRLIRASGRSDALTSGAGLVLGCRATDWSANLQQALEGRFGTCHLVELAPLSRDEAIRLASSAGVDGTRLVDAAVKLGAGFLAGVPLTLEILVRIWIERRELTGTPRELFGEAIDLLAAEPSNERLTPTTTAPSQIVAVARRIAAHLLLTGRRSIWTGGQLGAGPYDLPILSLTGGFESTALGLFSVDPPALQDTIASGIFTANGPNRVRFKHSSLAAYLCASYLLESETPASQLRLLLLNAAPDGTHGIPASLRETAAWLAGLNPEDSDWLARADPESLSSHSRLVNSSSVRRILVDSLLDQALEVELGDHWWRWGDLNLDHPGIVDQLAPVLMEAIANGPTDWKADARLRLALRIARESDDPGLVEVLLDFAKSDEWPCHLRAWAATAASSISRNSAASALVGLLRRLDELPDEDDQLRGALLRCLVPHALTHVDAIPYLTPKQNRDLFGAYRSFLLDFADDVPDSDVEALLAWALAASKQATGQSKTDASQPTTSAERRVDKARGRIPDEVLRSIPDVVLRSSHAERLSQSVADLLVTRLLETHEVEFPSSLGALPDEPEFGRATGLRRGLIVESVRVLTREGEHAASIMHGWKSDWSFADLNQRMNRRSSLVGSDDLRWLIETAHELSDDEPEVAEGLADLAPYVFDRTDAAQIETVWTNQIGPVWARLSIWFDAVELDGEIADRERYYRRIEREEPWNGSGDFVHELEALAEATHGENVTQLWHLLWNLQFDPATGRGQLFAGELFTSFPAFQHLSGHHQRLVRESARRFATTEHDHRSSWLGTDQHEKRAAAGYWCLAYLLSENPETPLASSTLEPWAGAIFWYPTIGHNENETSFRDDLLRQLQVAAPEQLADTLRRHCRGNLRRGESCWELRGLTPTDSEPVLGAFKGLADEIVHAIGRLGSSGPSDEAIDPGLVVELREGEASNAIDVLENLWAAIELADEEAVVTMLKSIIVAPDGGHEAIGALRVAAASTLLLDHSSGHWAAVSDLLMVDPNFGLAVARRSATNRSGSGFGRVPAATVAAIYEWLSSLYPSHQDTHRNGFVSPDQQAQDLRRSLLNELARRADAEALDAVRALCERLPDSIEVRATLVRARANSRAESWRGPSQADLHKMLESNTRRLVRNDDELFSVVVEALREIAVELETHGEFLWDRHVDLVGTTLWEPKYESSFSLYMAQQLRLRLSRTPTVVNREVVVRHTTATGAGERADILVQAPAADPGDQPASVVIEVKGQWNADLLVSLRSQLVDRYLPAANSRAGIYLVGWFPVEGWNHESWRRSSAARRKRRLVADDLEEQAKSCHGQTVKAILIDIPRPSVANDRSATDRPASG